MKKKAKDIIIQIITLQMFWRRAAVAGSARWALVPPPRAAAPAPATAQSRTRESPATTTAERLQNKMRIFFFSSFFSFLPWQCTTRSLLLTFAGSASRLVKAVWMGGTPNKEEWTNQPHLPNLLLPASWMSKSTSRRGNSARLAWRAAEKTPRSNKSCSCAGSKNVSDE